MSPTVRQRAALDRLLGLQCELYNAALEERRGAWHWERRSVSYFDQCRTLTGLRAVRPDMLTGGVTVCRSTLLRLDWAFAAFYRRCRTGERPGYPRFRSRTRWDSLQWEDRNGWRIDTATRRLHLTGVGALRVRLHRPLRGTPKAITVKREGRRWWVTIRCVDVPAEPLPATGGGVGIDLGVTILVATSDGDLIANDRHAERAARSLARAQQAVATKQRGSKHRRCAVERVAAVHRHIRNRRTDTLHKLSRRLVDDHDFIVHEQLLISNLVRRPKPKSDGDGGYKPNGATAKSGLNRCIHDTGWDDCSR